MYNACISFQAFLMFYAKIKVNVQLRINFKNESDLQFPFQRIERVENTQQFSFRKEKNFANLLKCTNSKQKQK